MNINETSFSSPKEHTDSSRQHGHLDNFDLGKESDIIGVISTTLGIDVDFIEPSATGVQNQNFRDTNECFSIASDVAQTRRVLCSTGAKKIEVSGLPDLDIGEEQEILQMIPNVQENTQHLRNATNDALIFETPQKSLFFNNASPAVHTPDPNSLPVSEKSPVESRYEAIPTQEQHSNDLSKSPPDGTMPIASGGESESFRDINKDVRTTSDFAQTPRPFPSPGADHLEVAGLLGYNIEEKEDILQMFPNLNEETTTDALTSEIGQETLFSNNASHAVHALDPHSLPESNRIQVESRSDATPNGAQRPLGQCHNLPGGTGNVLPPTNDCRHECVQEKSTPSNVDAALGHTIVPCPPPSSKNGSRQKSNDRQNSLELDIDELFAPCKDETQLTTGNADRNQAGNAKTTKKVSEIVGEGEATVDIHQRPSLEGSHCINFTDDDHYRELADILDPIMDVVDDFNNNKADSTNNFGEGAKQLSTMSHRAGNADGVVSVHHRNSSDGANSERLNRGDLNQILEYSSDHKENYSDANIQNFNIPSDDRISKRDKPCRPTQISPDLEPISHRHQPSLPEQAQGEERNPSGRHQSVGYIPACFINTKDDTKDNPSLLIEIPHAALATSSASDIKQGPTSEREKRLPDENEQPTSQHGSDIPSQQMFHKRDGLKSRKCNDDMHSLIPQANECRKVTENRNERRTEGLVGHKDSDFGGNEEGAELQPDLQNGGADERPSDKHEEQRTKRSEMEKITGKIMKVYRCPTCLQGFSKKRNCLRHIVEKAHQYKKVIVKQNRESEEVASHEQQDGPGAFCSSNVQERNLCKMHSENDDEAHQRGPNNEKPRTPHERQHEGKIDSTGVQKSVGKSKTVYRCPTCLRGFNRKYSCLRHIRTVHVKMVKFADEERTLVEPQSQNACPVPRTPLVPYSSNGQDSNSRTPCEQHDGIQSEIRREGSDDRDNGKREEPDVITLSIRKPIRKKSKWKIFRCPTCPRTFTRKGNCERHIEVVHLNQKCFKCTVCGKQFSTKQNLNCHKNTHAKTNDNQEGQS